MHPGVDSRMFAVNTLSAMGILVPERYMKMLGKTLENQVIADLSPWIFIPSPERSSGYCSEAFGKPILPFAQAVGQDLVACFLLDQSPDLAVVVINPWSSDRASVVKTSLPNYDAWLLYAERVSHIVRAQEPEDDDN